MKSRLRLTIRLEQATSLHRKWTFDDPETISIGFAPDASVWLLDSEAGPRTVLFRRRGQAFQLRVFEKLTGTLLIGDKEISLAELRDAGLMKSDREGAYLTVTEKTTGQLLLGKTTLAFSIGQSPSEPDYPLNPLFMRFIRNAPHLYIACFGISILAHVFLATYLHSLPPPPEPTIAEVSERFARFLLPSKTFIQERVQKLSETSTAPNVQDDSEPPKALPPPQGSGFLAAVTKTAVGKKASPFSGLFSSNTIGKSLNEALKGRSLDEALSAQARETTVSSSGSAPSMVEIGSLRGKDRPQVSLDKSVSTPENARILPDSRETEGTVDRELIERLIASNAGQFRDCYERALVRKKDLMGKLVISLALHPEGTPNDISVAESTLNDRLLENCVIGKLSSLQFPRPTKGSKTLKFPVVFSGATRG